MFKSISMAWLTLDKFLSLYLQFLNYKMRVKSKHGRWQWFNDTFPKLWMLWDSKMHLRIYSIIAKGWYRGVKHATFTRLAVLTTEILEILSKLCFLQATINHQDWFYTLHTQNSIVEKSMNAGKILQASIIFVIYKLYDLEQHYLISLHIRFFIYSIRSHIKGYHRTE